MNIKSIISNGFFKSSIILLAGIFVGWLFFYHSKTDSLEQTQQIAVKQIYTCSMHPQIRQDHKGLCPICGMELIPLNNLTSAENDSEITMTDEAVKLAEVQTYVVSKKQMSKEIHLYGKIVPDERMVQTLPSHVAGRIEKLYVNFTGEFIGIGQKIASIYSPNLIKAQQEFIETVKIKNEQPSIYSAAKEKLMQFKLTDKQINEIENSQKIKNNIDIYSDVSGVIITKNVNEGDYIQTGTSLFDLANLNNVWAMFDVYETDLPFVKLGYEIKLSLIAIPGKIFKGTVSYIDPVINPQSRTVKARVSLSNGNGEFKPEMLVDGTLNSKLNYSGKNIVIPSSAVLWTGKRSVVYLKILNKTEPTYKLREVILGNALNDGYEVISGLTEGDEVVTNGAFSIDAASQLAGKPNMLNISDSVNLKNQANSESDNNIEKNNIVHETFKVSGNCEMCKERIEISTKKLNGIINADWNIKTKMLKVSFDKNLINIDKIRTNIANVGHDNGKYKSTDEVYNNLPECCKYRNN